ncbi:hypothetical protein, partial [Caulobacter sp. 17J65-9]|uniref:hypothetical protein n=1 Tax=Caulobacter sp. 17J65-9 TaxID=2709382 RepID=UPI0013C6DE9D
ARELAALPDRAAVLAECRAALAAAEPAPPAAFALTLERLALHYPESRLTPPEQTLVAKDWRRLAGHLPADVLARAADDYVLSPARFFPTPGQLLALAEPAFAWRRALARRARQTLDLIGPENEGRPPCPAARGPAPKP